MSELLIYISVVPIVLLIFSKSRAVLWLPAVVAALCVANSLYLHIDDLKWWGPVASFFALAIAEFVENRKINSLSVLCLFFVAQALLATEVVNIILCLVLGDMFLNVEIFTSTKLENKNTAVHNIYKSLFSYFPALLGVLLNLKGDPFTAMVSLTIVLRLFSWPIKPWHSCGSRFSSLLISAGSTFALWHVLDFSAQPEWAIVWLGVAAILSLGAGYAEMYLALALGVFCISPFLGVLATAAWPLLLHRGRASHFVVLITGFLGLLICDFSTKVFIENAMYGIAGVTAIAIARPFDALEIQARPYLKDAGDLILALGLMGVFIYLNPLSSIVPGPIGLTFAAVFILAYSIGLFLRKKKPKLFHLFSPLAMTFFPDREEPLGALKETPGATILFRERPTLLKLYSLLESEGHLVWLLGALGIALVWGLK